MTNFDPNAYVKGAAGSISGFNITGVDDPTMVETNQSLAVLMRYLKQLVDQDAPSKIRQLERTALRHMRDRNNPHKDTVEDLTDGDIGLLFQRYFPGTTPLVPPDYTYSAFWEMGAPFSNATVLRDSELNVIDEQGFLSYAGPNTVGVDWSEGYPQIPCWPATTELIGDTSIVKNDKFSYPNLTPTISQSAGVTPTQFGYRIAFLETAGQHESSVTFSDSNVLVVGGLYTFNLFLNPITRPDGSFYIDLNEHHAWIRVSDFTQTLTTADATLYIRKLASGWIRIGITAPATKGDVVCKFGYDPHVYTDVDTAVEGIANNNRSYICYDNTPIFTLFGPNLVDQPGMPPFIQSGSLAETKLMLPGCVGAVPLDSGMISWKGQIYTHPKEPNAGNLLSGDGLLTISAKQGALTTSVETYSPAVPITSSYTDADYTSLAISYAIGKLSQLTNTSPRTDLTSFSPSVYSGSGTFANLTVGPFRGGVSQIIHYAVSDDKQSLEFLVG